MTGTSEPTVSADLVDRYLRDGYLHVPAMLSAAEVETFRADALEQLGRHSTVSWDHEDGNVMDWVSQPERSSPAMRQLPLHPRITAIAEQLAGRPLRMFKTELLRKRTDGSAATPLHIDAPAFPIGGAPVTLTAWVALTDVPVERGCMSFIPGSHHWPEGSPANFDPIAARPELRWWPRVTVPVRAGDCTFHHARLAHLAGANHTDSARISLATVYMDADAVFRHDPQSAYQDEVPDHEPGGRFDPQRYPRATASA
ncbi:phytanoyl-CoA dioxygenase family protein [Nocardia sp. NPDC127526]|uniref:phytanoyl-CoA dioxygenase family protein n=1 Tax=Nocardia sp. NPDC127526 TaxID=3345393 RepID=UPI00364224A9